MKKYAIAAAVLAATTSAAFAGGHGDGKGNWRDKGIEAIDLNKDGKIDTAEFVAAATERAGKHFDEVDADKNGSVTRDEYLASAETKAAERFSKMDRNGDGTLTKDDRPKRDHKKSGSNEPPSEADDTTL